jgi:hypothetical protein
MLTLDRHAVSQIGEARFTFVSSAVVGVVGALVLAMRAAGVSAAPVRQGPSPARGAQRGRVADRQRGQ